VRTIRPFPKGIWGKSRSERAAFFISLHPDRSFEPPFRLIVKYCTNESGDFNVNLGMKKKK
jgi:hypothetical protein